MIKSEDLRIGDLVRVSRDVINIVEAASLCTTI